MNITNNNVIKLTTNKPWSFGGLACLNVPYLKERKKKQVYGATRKNSRTRIIYSRIIYSIINKTIFV